MYKSSVEWDMILIDFDGVISKNIVSIMYRAINSFINNFVPTPLEATKEAMRNSVGLSMKTSFNLLLESFGITESLPDLYQAMINMEEIAGETIKIEPDFIPFINFCKQKKIPFKIFSMADKKQSHVVEILKILGEDKFFNMEGFTKQNIKLYPKIAEQLNINLDRCLMIDDSCVALSTAKKFGVKTIMMENELFTKKDFQTWQPYIDYCVNSFEQIKILLRQTETNAVEVR